MTHYSMFFFFPMEKMGTKLDSREITIKHYRQQIFTAWNCGKLTQKYFVDAQAKIEYCLLNSVSQNQTTIRSEKYQGLLNAVAVGDGTNMAKKIILPSPITGSPRWYAERFQDAMTMVREFGKRFKIQLIKEKLSMTVQI